jgi:VanZ family protein
VARGRHVVIGQWWRAGAPVSDPARFQRPQHAGSETGAPALGGKVPPPPLTHYRVAPTGSFLVLCAVPKLRLLVRHWLPVLVWMWIIFSASGDRQSMQHSSRIIEPVVRWLLPHLSDDAVRAIVLLARKCAHLAEFAVLALLLWRALRKAADPGNASWRWSEASLALALVALYAASDELHQAFVPPRQGCVGDVLLDTTGAALGLLCLWAAGRWRKRW